MSNLSIPDSQQGPAIRVQPEFDALEMIEVQRRQIRRREFRPLGKLEKIMLGENAVPRPEPDNPLVRRGFPVAISLDWRNKGPLIGLSQDEQDVLIVGQMIHPPDYPDPHWKQGPPKKFVNGFPVPETPRMVPQRLRDRCYGSTLDKDRKVWLIFQPITQILFLLQERTGMGIIRCEADYSGRHATLLYNRKLQEGHLLFGSKEFNRYT